MKLIPDLVICSSRPAPVCSVVGAQYTALLGSTKLLFQVYENKVFSHTQTHNALMRLQWSLVFSSQLVTTQVAETETDTGFR